MAKWDVNFFFFYKYSIFIKSVTSCLLNLQFKLFIFTYFYLDINFIKDKHFFNENKN